MWDMNGIKESVEAHELNVALKHVLSSTFEVDRKLGHEGLFQVETPFVWEDKDPYQVYVEQCESGKLRVTDCSATMAKAFSYETVDDYEDTYEYVLFMRLVRNSGFSFDDESGAIYRDVDNTQNLVSFTILDLCQLIAKIEAIDTARYVYGG